MPNRAHSRAVKLAAVVLARQAGIEAAVAAFRVDDRTVRRWLDTMAVPDDEWTAIRDVLRARAAEMAARGTTTGLVAVLTGAGIADRNVRYGELITRREARREAEREPEPVKPAWLVAVEALDEPRGTLLGAELRHELTDRGGPDAAGPAESADTDAAMLAFVEAIAAMPDDEVRDRLLELEPAWAGTFGWQGPVATLRDAIDAIDGPTGGGTPAPAVTLIEDGSPEGIRARLARDVSPGAPEPRPEPVIGRDGVWRESPVDAPDAWDAWRRYEA